jgi:hypothetical protein
LLMIFDDRKSSLRLASSLNPVSIFEKRSRCRVYIAS